MGALSVNINYFAIKQNIKKLPKEKLRKEIIEVVLERKTVKQLTLKYQTISQKNSNIFGEEGALKVPEPFIDK
jgi:lipase chaperone LimK